MLKLYVWMKGLTDRIREERGQDMVEYALITAIMAVIIVGVLFIALQGALNNWVDNIAALIENPGPAADPPVG